MTTLLDRDVDGVLSPPPLDAMSWFAEARRSATSDAVCSGRGRLQRCSAFWVCACVRVLFKHAHHRALAATEPCPFTRHGNTCYSMPISTPRQCTCWNAEAAAAACHARHMCLCRDMCCTFPTVPVFMCVRVCVRVCVCEVARVSLSAKASWSVLLPFNRQRNMQPNGV